jgi:hypothetical protein
MNKQQAYNAFWSGFGVLAFEENAVPDDATIDELVKSGAAPSKYPYITYQVLTGDLDDAFMPTASIWDNNTSWKRIDLLTNEISEYIARMTPIKLDTGRMFISGLTSQHMAMEDDITKKRNVLTVNVEFFTSY